MNNTRWYGEHRKPEMDIGSTPIGKKATFYLLVSISGSLSLKSQKYLARISSSCVVCSALCETVKDIVSKFFHYWFQKDIFIGYTDTRFYNQ